MSDVFKTNSWAIKVPDAWVVDDNEEAIAFTPAEEEAAALIVSAFSKHDGAITMDDMQEALRSPEHESAECEPVVLGDYSGCYAHFERHSPDGLSVWRVWALFCRSLHLYVTYNCAPQVRGRHDRTVEEMLRTLMCLREA